MVDLLLVLPLVVYLVALLAIGFLSSRRISDRSDYFLGGKKLPGWALALSERSTDMSAWLIISVPALAYTMGLEAIWVPVGCYIGSVIQWVFYSKKLREEQEKYGAITAVDYLAKKHRSKAVRALGAVTCLIFYTIYTASQFAGAGKILRQTFGLPIIYGMIIAAAVIIIYSVTGGFMSVVWTDVIQALLMIITLCVTPIIGIYALRANGLTLMGTLRTNEMLNPFGNAKGIGIALLLGTHLSWIFGYLGGEPHFFIRHMAVRNEKERKQAMVIAMVWGLFIAIGSWALGAVAFALFGPNAVVDPEDIMPFAVMTLMPPVIAGILLSGAIAGMMSSVDSQLLVASSAASEDLYCELISEGRVKENRALLISRMTVVVIGVFALLFALFGSDVVYTLVSYGWSGLAGAFAPSITLSLFWKRFSKAGVCASFITGILTTVLWISLGLSVILTERIVSFIIPFVAAVIASLAFPDTKKVINEQKE
ncbi:MAG: sodium/proline symporter [Candidatus Thermoplasmatota archaeon]|nr:sodium/proline symporter [Candidatus Thermoplasmatota archaeon]